MTYDLIIRKGSAVLEDRVAVIDIGIADGVIAAVENDLPGGATEEVDARGLHVLPGQIDVHVHFNDPGRAEWEGIETGSAALATGGGTCFFDMPLNASPPTLDGPSFDAKRKAAEGRSTTDFGLWGGLVPGNLDRLDELAERGVVGFKAFMADSGIEDFPRADDMTLLEGMARAARLGLPVAVHAESEDITHALTARRRAEGRRGVRDYLASRPGLAELEAIQRATLFAEETGCALHIVHVSSGEGVALVVEARQRGVDVTCETCPHYLVFTDEDVVRIGAAAKCAPPIRSGLQREGLWAGVERGDVDLIASDHSPAPLALKEPDDFFEAWGGIAGCQSTLSIMLREGYLGRGIPLTRLARLTASAPADRFGIIEKGRIAPEHHADLTLVNLNTSKVLRPEHLQYRHAVTPYVGRRLHGFVHRVLVRGTTVVADARPTGARPGQLVKPASRNWGDRGLRMED